MSAGTRESSRTNVSSKLLHDMRSHLNQIIGYSEMLTEEAPADKPGADAEKISQAGRQMLSLIDRSFMAGGPANEPVRLREIVAIPSKQTVSATANPGTILVVDDDATNRDVLSRRLKRQGHSVHAVSNGVEALQLVRQHDFDLMLLDIMMPGMDGHEVLRHLKSDVGTNHLPVIMISALSEVQSVVRCIEAGAEDYLTKPFDATLLKARVDASLDKKRSRDREAALFIELELNYSKLKEVEKLRDDMRNMIVHDLRTPLTAVIAGVEMLERYGGLNEPQREMMTIAVSGGATLLGMINDLLDVEKMESGSPFLNMSELAGATLLVEAATQVATLAEQSGVTITTTLPMGDVRFRGDEGKLRRTLVNLIANAVKFTQRGGTVTLSILQSPTDVEFVVCDTGEGIATEAFERIFEKFGQLNAGNRVGTGLGLAFCKLAVEAHGGRIRVESTPGIGSTFSFTIPLSGAHA